MDVVRLKHAAQIGFVRRTGPQASDRGVLVAESLQEGIGELCGIEWLFGHSRDSFLDFYSIQIGTPAYRPQISSWTDAYRQRSFKMKAEASRLGVHSRPSSSAECG